MQSYRVVFYVGDFINYEYPRKSDSFNGKTTRTDPLSGDISSGPIRVL